MEPSYLSILPYVNCTTRSVSDYLEQHPGNMQLLQSGLIKGIMEKRFDVITEVISTLSDFLHRNGKTYPLILICTSTCQWSPYQAIELNNMAMKYLTFDGNIRVMCGKGCNTFSDTLGVMSREIGSGAISYGLVVNIESTDIRHHRLQSYAFFSDVCIGVELSSKGGDFTVLGVKSCRATYKADEFHQANDLTCPSPLIKERKNYKILTLNNFPFVQKFKFGSSDLYDHLILNEVGVHRYGADAFYYLQGDRAYTDNFLIHVESPPGHVNQMLLKRNH